MKSIRQFFSRIAQPATSALRVQDAAVETNTNNSYNELVYIANINKAGFAAITQAVSAINTSSLQSLGVNIMALADDVAALTAAVTALTTTVSSASSELDTLLADLNAALAASGTALDPAVQAAVTALGNLNTSLQGAVTRDTPPT